MYDVVFVLILLEHLILNNDREQRSKTLRLVWLNNDCMWYWDLVPVEWSIRKQRLTRLLITCHQVKLCFSSTENNTCSKRETIWIWLRKQGLEMVTTYTIQHRTWNSAYAWRVNFQTWQEQVNENRRRRTLLSEEK